MIMVISGLAIPGRCTITMTKVITYSVAKPHNVTLGQLLAIHQILYPAV